MSAPLTSSPVTLTTADGVRLESEVAAPSGTPRAGAVLCHPHPRFGGNMRSLVVGEWFGALPHAGVTCVRFNFRGVEGSDGMFDDGEGEHLDAEAALAHLAGLLPPGAPLVMAGWSFGADVALATTDPLVGGWVAVAPPSRYGSGPATVSSDPRPKLVVFGERDDLVDARTGAEAAATWAATRVEVIPGADHFFVGSTSRIVELTLRLVDTAASP